MKLYFDLNLLSKLLPSLLTATGGGEGVGKGFTIVVNMTFLVE